MDSLFKQLGLDAKETKVFLALLELGAQPVSVVAKRTGIPRSSMYVILERLKGASLIEEFERSGITYVRSVSARGLVEVLEARKSEAQQLIEMAERELPALEALENKMSVTPQVQFFEGKKAVQRVYEQIGKEKLILALFNPQLVEKRMPGCLGKVADMIRDNDGQAREMIVAGADASAYKKKYHSDAHQIHILTKDIAVTSDLVICPDRIYMIAYGDREITATQIVSPSISETQKTLFVQLWQKIDEAA